MFEIDRADRVHFSRSLDSQLLGQCSRSIGMFEIDRADRCRRRRKKREVEQRNDLTIKNDHKKAMLEEGSGIVREETRLALLLDADRGLKRN
jgi:hypothetical protein